MPTIRINGAAFYFEESNTGRNQSLCSRPVVEPSHKFRIGVASHSEKLRPVSSARQGRLFGDNQTPVGSAEIIYVFF